MCPRCIFPRRRAHKRLIRQAGCKCNPETQVIARLICVVPVLRHQPGQLRSSTVGNPSWEHTPRRKVRPPTASTEVTACFRGSRPVELLGATPVKTAFARVSVRAESRAMPPFGAQPLLHKKPRAGYPGLRPRLPAIAPTPQSPNPAENAPRHRSVPVRRDASDFEAPGDS